MMKMSILLSTMSTKPSKLFLIELIQLKRKEKLKRNMLQFVIDIIKIKLWRIGTNFENNEIPMLSYFEGKKEIMTTT